MNIPPATQVYSDDLEPASELELFEAMFGIRVEQANPRERRAHRAARETNDARAVVAAGRQSHNETESL